MPGNHTGKFNTMGSRAINSLSPNPGLGSSNSQQLEIENQSQPELKGGRVGEWRVRKWTGSGWGQIVGVYWKANLGVSFPTLGFLCSWRCTRYAMRTVQWVNSSVACRIIQNICELGWGQARQFLHPSGDSRKLGVPGHQDLCDSPWSSLLWEDRRLWGPTTCLEILNHQAAYSLFNHILPEMELPCPSPNVGLSPCPLEGVESCPSAVCFGCMCWGEGEGRGRQGLPTAASHRPGVLSPSAVKWLKKYLSHKRNEARAAKEESGLLSQHRPRGPLCSDLFQAPKSINGSQCLLTKYKALNPLLASPSNICVLRNLWSFLFPPPPGCPGTMLASLALGLVILPRDFLALASSSPPCMTFLSLPSPSWQAPSGEQETNLLTATPFHRWFRSLCSL